MGLSKVEVLYTQCDGHALKVPNNIVFDTHGGMWFTDFGKTYDRSRDWTGKLVAWDARRAGLRLNFNA